MERIETISMISNFIINFHQVKKLNTKDQFLIVTSKLKIIIQCFIFKVAIIERINNKNEDKNSIFVIFN